MTACVVYITASSREEAMVIGRTLVEERLAACANVIENATSIYWWDGKLEDATEAVLFAKTQERLVEAIIGRVKELHSYECPCVVSWPIAGANAEYLEWIAKETE